MGKIHVGAKAFDRYLEDLVGQGAAQKIHIFQGGDVGRACDSEMVWKYGYDVVNGRELVRAAFAAPANLKREFYGKWHYFMRDFDFNGALVSKVDEFELRGALVGLKITKLLKRNKPLGQKAKMFLDFYETASDKVGPEILKIPVMHLPIHQKDVPGFDFNATYEVLKTDRMPFKVTTTGSGLFSGSSSSLRGPLEFKVEMMQEDAYELRADAIIIDSSKMFQGSAERPCVIVKERQKPEAA